jgi:tellurite methyltransferase
MPGPEGYDRFYQKNKEGFSGGRPDQVVRDILKYRKDGSVLEIGAGEGRHARFLADQGFQVTAFDRSEVGIESLREKAAAQGLSIKAEVKDATELELSEKFDVMVNTYMLHHLPREEALELIRVMQEHTNVDGINAITAFMRQGDIYSPDSAHRFLPEPNELRDLYKDWEILEYTEAETSMAAKKPDGTHMKNYCAGLLARKLPPER